MKEEISLSIAMEWRNTVMILESHAEPQIIFRKHAVEKVTNGYRLALEYSICLPPTIHEYDLNCFEDLGVGALKGVDTVRFHALKEENSLGASTVEMALQILDELEDEDAQNNLYKVAVEKIDQLTKWVMRKNDNPSDEILKQADPSELGPAIEKALQYLPVGDITANGENSIVGAFDAIVTRRIEWLKEKIDEFDKPFSLVMVDSHFSDIEQVQYFLRGPEPTIQITKRVFIFQNFQDASSYTAKMKQRNASFKMEAITLNADSVVTVKKSRKWFLAELNLLLGHVGGEEEDRSDKKRARLK
ncbi:hypothetical protein PHMEG_0002077 [Phytophthora megakarya]|uniref:Uncharacterized protein n=1 Tax=Phytophthora megakarya TaxID=4795 RepID=A0A225WZI4_9STRA|nr:hypothetical protein PHMEG_0002077 [Phytophthora megakarya]